MILLILSIITIIAMVMIGDERGVSAMLTIIWNLLVMAICFVALAHGSNVYLTTLLCALVLLLLTLFFQNGYNLKTRAAFRSILLVLVLLGALVAFIIPFFGIGGFGELVRYEEEITFLDARIGIDAGQLLFSAIVLGLLGALVDTSLSVASALYEVHQNSPEMDQASLFTSGMNVGKDIIGTMINTLVHAEFGASFFVWMIFIREKVAIPELLNSRSFLQAALLILVANIGCLAVIPLTAYITSHRLVGQSTESEVDPNASDVLVSESTK